MGDENSDKAFDELASATDYGSLVRAAGALVDSISPSALSASTQFRRTIVRLGQEAGVARPDERLLALVLLTRLKKGGQEIKKLAGAQLKSLLAIAPASCASIVDDKVRAAVYALIAKHRADWVAEYLAVEAVNCDRSDKLRSLAVTGVLLNSETWAAALNVIADAIPHVSDGSPGEMANRSNVIRSVLNAVRASIGRSGTPPGVGLGQVIGRFITLLEGEAKVGASGGISPQARAAAEAVQLAESSLALRPLVALDPALFVALGRARNLMPGKRWLPQVSRSVGSIMIKIADILFGFAGKGIAAKELFDGLELLGGSREATLKLTHHMARAIEGIPARVATLLTEGYLPSEDSGALRDSEEAILATALLRADELASAFAQGAGEAGPGGSSYREFAVALITEVQSLARRRGLAVDGKVGADVRFSPLLHRAAGGNPAHGAMVRVAVPGVVRRVDGRPAEVVVLTVVDATEPQST